MTAKVFWWFRLAINQHEIGSMNYIHQAFLLSTLSTVLRNQSISATSIFSQKNLETLRIKPEALPFPLIGNKISFEFANDWILILDRIQHDLLMD